jgi:hypothetical protein
MECKVGFHGVKCLESCPANCDDFGCFRNGTCKHLIVH